MIVSPDRASPERCEEERQNRLDPEPETRLGMSAEMSPVNRHGHGMLRRHAVRGGTGPRGPVGRGTSCH